MRPQSNVHAELFDSWQRPQQRPILITVGAGGLVVEYRIRNFHAASANLALGSCKQP